jgi:hypothetical protein
MIQSAREASGVATAQAFELTAQPGEYFVFQLGIWAPNTGLDDVSLMFTDFTTTTGHTIPAQKITSFNQKGRTGEESLSEKNQHQIGPSTTAMDWHGS